MLNVHIPVKTEHKIVYNDVSSCARDR